MERREGRKRKGEREGVSEWKGGKRKEGREGDEGKGEGEGEGEGRKRCESCLLYGQQQKKRRKSNK